MSLGVIGPRVPWSAGRGHAIGTFLEDAWVPMLVSTASKAWGTQYRAIYVPIRVPSRITVKELAYNNNTTSAGNIDIGIYNSAGTKLVSSGSTAKSATGAIISVDVTDTTIGPGTYYLALNNDTTTDTVAGMTLAAPLPAAYGVLTETLGAVTLPDTATWAVDQALAWLPGIFAMFTTEVD